MEECVNKLVENILKKENAKEIIVERILWYEMKLLEKDEEIERLNNIVNASITKVQEIKDKIDKSKFDGTTKCILIMALNEIIYSLNGKGEDKE